MTYRLIVTQRTKIGVVVAPLDDSPRCRKERKEAADSSGGHLAGGCGSEVELAIELVPEVVETTYTSEECYVGTAMRRGPYLSLGLCYEDAYQGHGDLMVRYAVLAAWSVALVGKPSSTWTNSAWEMRRSGGGAARGCTQGARQSGADAVSARRQACLRGMSTVPRLLRSCRDGGWSKSQSTSGR